MIVVSTPTGNIGSQLLPHLLAAGEQVRVIARDPSKLPSDVRDRVEVVQGASDDPAVIDQALAGADALFWVVPPSFQISDVPAHYLDFTRPAVAAIKAHGVKHVVSVSSLGRKLGMKAGVVSAAHAMEALLESSGAHHRGLWCPSFMDNTLRQLYPIKHQGAFYLPNAADLKVPHACTRDIAATAAKLLLDRSWSGPGGVAVMGPEDLSHNDMAAILSDVLGSPVRYQEISLDAYREVLTSRGASAGMADSLVEMHDAINHGLYNGDVRTPENTTPTSFRQWCEEVLKPALASV